MTKIVLVRHGETVWHAENRYAGQTDVALTPRGVAQAQRLADWAAGAELDAIWCSTLSRAKATAAAAAESTGLVPREDARLRELHFGDAEGLTTAEMQTRFPDALHAFQTDPVTHHLPGGEDPRLAVERAMAVLGDIQAARPDGRVLVVAHTTLIRLVLCHLMDVPVAAYRRLFPFVRNGAITEVRLDARGVALLEFNTPLDGAEPRSAEPAATPVRDYST